MKRGFFFLLLTIYPSRSPHSMEAHVSFDLRGIWRAVCSWDALSLSREVLTGVAKIMLTHPNKTKLSDNCCHKQQRSISLYINIAPNFTKLQVDCSSHLLPCIMCIRCLHHKLIYNVGSVHQRGLENWQSKMVCWLATPLSCQWMCRVNTCKLNELWEKPRRSNRPILTKQTQVDVTKTPFHARAL